MRITKILLMLAIFFMTGIATANAQIVESRSKSIKVEKISHPHPMEWFLKAGGGITAVTEGDKIGNYNAALGFKRYFGHQPKGGYWGAMLGSTLYEYADDIYGNDSKPSFYLGPQIGYAKFLSESLTFDIHLLGAYQFALIDDSHHHVMGQLGLGLWFRNFLVEFDYQPSFIDNDGNGNNINHSFIFNIGYRF